MNPDFAAAYADLRALMLRASEGSGVTVAKDETGDLVLRTLAVDPKTKQPGWFGTVTAKKAYVAFHLMPLYDRPELADALSPELAKRRQGKTCFNFKRPDPTLFAELEQLTRRAATS